MTYLEILNEEKNHRILVEKLAFLDYINSVKRSIGIRALLQRSNFLKEEVEKWNKEDIKNTPYGQLLFKHAEELTRLKLRED